MASLADLMKNSINDTIFTAIGEVMLSGINEIPGVYNAIPADSDGPGAAVGTVRHEFHCQFTAPVQALTRGAQVSISGNGNAMGTFTVQRVQKPDETGRVIVELSKGA